MHHIRVKRIVLAGCRHLTEVNLWVGSRPEQDRFEVVHDDCESFVRVELLKKTARVLLGCERWRRTNAGKKAIAKVRKQVRLALGEPDEDDVYAQLIPGP